MTTTLKSLFTIDLSTSKGRLRLAGFVILGVFAFAAIFAPIITPYDPSEQVCDPFESPNSAHWLGCNDVGQDLLTELVYGARISLAVGVLVAIVSTVVATIVALISGYMGGWVDQMFMRTVDVMMSLPFLPLVIVLGVFLGASLTTQVFVISLVMWAHPARELRSQVLSIRESGYVEAALAMGASHFSIMFHHILPELTPLIVPQFVRVAHNAILIEAALSFLGLGDPVQKSWGSILFYANARAAFLTGAWTYWVLPPGICIALVVVAFAFVGYSLGGKSGQMYSPFGSFSLTRKSAASKPSIDGKRLEIDHLTTQYKTGSEKINAVDDTSLDINEREIVGIVGESGSGKSTIAMTVLGLLRYPTSVASGSIFLGDTEVLGLDKKTFQQLRGKQISFIPQSAMNTLNPVMTIKTQLMEAIQLHQNLSKGEAETRALDLLRIVEIPTSRARSFPHELSGGMRQRVVAAMALANEPEVIIADEPTTGLDVIVQKEFIGLLVDLQHRLGVSVMFITHDLPLVSSFANRLAVMYQGKIVDVGSPFELSQNAVHFHTKELFNNFPRINAPKRWVRANASSSSNQGTEPLLHLAHVTKTFNSKRRGLRQADTVTAVNDVSFDVYAGEVVGLIGGSGSGKTTLARLIMGLIKPDEGEINFDGYDVPSLNNAERREMLRSVQMIFQDPYQSMRNGLKIVDVVSEPLRIQGVRDEKTRVQRVTEALDKVNLPTTAQFLRRTPTELSGGQRQRVAVARAIITNPSLIIADEPTSMLDVSLRMNMLELLESLRLDNNVGYLFITHDLALARHFCDRLVVLQHGQVVENGWTDDVILHPQHEYTQALIGAVEDPIISTVPTVPGTGTLGTQTV